MTLGLDVGTLTLKLFDAISPVALKKLVESTGSIVIKTRAQFQGTFSSHLENTIQRCSEVKTLFSKETPVAIEQIYVNLTLKNESRTITDLDLINPSRGHKRIVVIGTGGAGKSMILKYLAFKITQSSNGTIPILIELRDLVEHLPADFYKTILRYIVPNPSSDQQLLFEAGLRSGIFTLFLDGLDEIAPERRVQVYRSIQRLAIDFPETKVIASTRPEMNLASWEKYTTYKVKPLSIEQALELVRKVEFDAILKERFSVAITTGLFESHESFLGVPLLCSLMLLTYADNLSIPTKSTLFYEQAFETLQRTHDRSKGYYKRTYSSNMEQDEFLYVLYALCFRTLAKGEISFHSVELYSHIERAAQICGVALDSQSFADDIVSSLCLLVQDGLRLHFVHRSFQEFFAAKFALRYRQTSTFELFSLLARTVENRSIAMAAELDIQTVEKEWSLPILTEMQSVIGETQNANSVRQLLNYITKSVDLVFNGQDTEIVGWGGPPSIDPTSTIGALQQIYPESLLLNDFVLGISQLSGPGNALHEFGRPSSGRNSDMAAVQIYTVEILNIPEAFLSDIGKFSRLYRMHSKLNELFVEVRDRVNGYCGVELLN